METFEPEVTRLCAAKEKRQHELAALPFTDKVRAVVRLQHMVAPILRARGRSVCVWNREETDPMTRSSVISDVTGNAENGPELESVTK